MEKKKKFFHDVNRRDFLKQAALTSAFTLGGLAILPKGISWGKREFSGITIDYWNQINVQNRLVKVEAERAVREFEKATGAKVNISWHSYGDIIGPKYRTNFKAGVRPTLFDSDMEWAGAIRKYLRPFNDLIETDLDKKIRESIRWMEPYLKDMNRCWPDKEKIYSMVLWSNVCNPLCTRTDHWKKAGINFEENWPIRSYDHFIDICQRFKKAGVSEYPTEVYGSTFDAGDCALPCWAVAKDRERGTFFNKDCSDVNVDSNVWLETIQQYVDIFRKYHLASPRSPKSGDEVAAEEIALGKKSLVDIEYSNRGILMDRAPELLEKGVIQWGPSFDLGSGSVGNFHIWSFHIVKQEGPDAEVKERCAWELIKFLLKPESQIAIAKPLGSLPLRKDLWDQLKGTPEHLIEPHIQMEKTRPRVWSSHPLQVDVQYNKFGPRMSNILRGRDLKEEISAYVKEIRTALGEFNIKEYL